VKTESCETTPVPVFRYAGAKPTGEIRARWAWTERTVWTDRMLTALEQGVKGGVWFSLIDKVYSLPNLQAWRQPASDHRPGQPHDARMV